MSPTPDRGRPRLVVVAALAVIGSTFALRLPLLWVDPFNPDEFEHLHASYSLASGLVPYRDFFENHAPLLHFALLPLFRLFDAEGRPEQAVALVLAARVAMWVLSGASVALLAAAVRLASGPAEAAMAGALLCGTSFFLNQGFEVRPDVLALTLLLASWWALVAAARASRRAWPLFAAAGACLALATLSTQKVLFAWPAGFVAVAFWAVREAPCSARARGIAAWLGGLALPILLLSGWFAHKDALGPFVDQNVLLNARWHTTYSPRPNLEELVSRNGPAAALALAGAALALLPRARAVKSADVLPVAALGSLLAGAFVIPVPLDQYFLPMMPPLAWLAAGALVRLGSRFAHEGPLLAGALVLLSARPLLGLAGELGTPPKQPAWTTLEHLGWVAEHVAPAESVLDGNTGLGVFRPHAWFYFYPNQDIRPFISDAKVAELIRSLRDGTVAPRLAILDRDLRAVDGELLAFLEENYRPTGVGDVWALRDEPIDGPQFGGRLALGAGPTLRLAGNGFFPPRHDEGRWFRESRGRASSIRVPLASASHARLILHARRDLAAPGAAVAVRLNDHELGVAPLGEGWRDYAFAVPPGTLRLGLNRLALVYPLTPRDSADSGRLRNVVIAVEHVRLE